MLERSEIKTRAREQVRGNIGILFLIGLVVAVVYSLSAFTAIGALIIAGPIMLSYAFIYKGLSEGVRPKLDNILDGFRSNFAAAIIASILKNIFLFLWSLLIIPGIVKQYSYYMTFYVLSDNPNMTAVDAITESRRIMYGNKFKLFAQHLSFILWILLVIVTAGIAAIWVSPYITAADYNFYLDIRETVENEQEVSA